MRTLFGQELRKETTEAFYPNPITLGQFVKKITAGAENFEKNLAQLGKMAEKEKFVEEWAEMFLAWLEIEPN